METDAAGLQRDGKKSCGIPAVKKMYFTVTAQLLYLHSSDGKK